MGEIDQFIDTLILNMINELSSETIGKNKEIVTVALYYDHENKELLACADTLENSKKSILKANSFSSKFFHDAIERGDLEEASHWQGLTGRSLMLGDFASRNLARTLVPSGTRKPALFVAMARGLIRNSETILSICDPKKQIVFATSTAENEVGLIWVQREELSNVQETEAEYALEEGVVHEQPSNPSLFQKLFSKQ